MTRVLSAADRVAVPWKNGGGITREVAVWPSGAGFETFHWRVSMAEVREAGPFSAFPGIDRTLAVLRGRLRLILEDRSVELGPGEAPYSFPGDVPCHGEPMEGPVTDLNVMTRRGVISAQVARIANGTAAATLVVATARCVLSAGDERIPLAEFDAALLDRPSSVALTGEAIAIRFA